MFSVRCSPWWFIPVLVALPACVIDLPTPSSDVCFEEHVAPLVRRDCALCHASGEYLVRLGGTADDYLELERYIYDPARDESPLLAWAAGFKEHPAIWTEKSEEYGTMAAWIDEGALRLCLDVEQEGECFVDEDCPMLPCTCPDGSALDRAACQIDEDTQLGYCAVMDDCPQIAVEECP